MTWEFICKQDHRKCLLMSTSSNQPCSSKICRSWIKPLSCGVEGITYSKCMHQVLKPVETNMFTWSHSKLLTAPSDNLGYLCYLYYFNLWLALMACLGISSLHDLLPFWVKHLLTTMGNSDQPYTRSLRNTSLQRERNRSPASEYVPGITVLPSPPPSYLFTASKSAMHGEIDENGY